MSATSPAPVGEPVEKPVEKPPHVDDARMRHLTPEAVRDALAPGLAGTDLRSHLSARQGVVPARNPVRWAEWARGGERAKRTIADADALLQRQVDFLDPAHGRSGLYGFHYLGWTDPLTNAAALTGEERYVRRYAELVDQWYASRDHVVGEWPGLDVVWYTLGVACRSQVLLRALHVLGPHPAFPDASWHRILATLLGGARWLAEEHDAFRPGNWQLAGCAVLGEIAAYLPEFAEAQRWRRVARERLIEHLELDVHPDGGHHERSPSYHVMCVNALRSAAVTDPAIRQHPRLRAMHDWLLTMATPGGVVPPFNDSHLVYAGGPLLRGWHLHDDERYLAAALRWLSPDEIAETLAWLSPRELPDDRPTLPERGSAWLPTSKFAVLRSGEHQASVNCGPYVEHELESHSHHTALDLVVWAHGAPVAWEAGGPETYDDPAYQSWFRATRAHNTLVVGDPGAPPADMSEEHDSEVERCELGGEVEHLIASHRGWGGTHRREVRFVRGDEPYWLIRDTYADAPFRWWMHGLAPWVAEGTAFHTGAGPGILVLPTGTPLSVDTASASGPTHVPGPEGTGVPGTAHGLGLAYPAGTVTHVLVPYADEPPRVALSGPEDAPELHVTHHTDREDDERHS